VQKAKLVEQPAPVYPPLARQARISGVVRLSVIIGRDGTVQDLTLLSGHPLLVPAAMDAVKQWVYQSDFVERAGGRSGHAGGSEFRVVAVVGQTTALCRLPALPEGGRPQKAMVRPT